MLTLTTQAKEKLNEALLDETTNPRIAFRITSLSLKPTKFWLILDNENEGDYVIENKDGRSILLISSRLAPKLNGMILDHQELPNDAI